MHPCHGYPPPQQAMGQLNRIQRDRMHCIASYPTRTDPNRSTHTFTRYQRDMTSSNKRHADTANGIKAMVGFEPEWPVPLLVSVPGGASPPPAPPLADDPSPAPGVDSTCSTVIESTIGASIGAVSVAASVSVSVAVVSSSLVDVLPLSLLSAATSSFGVVVGGAS
mmetsp:Transcript_14151/g.29138  ORF Transcript_14151/g.29138 Transcript_14151/m.29138 type:complete len:166 (+) Transcript_14151:405-902(+)